MKRGLLLFVLGWPVGLRCQTPQIDSLRKMLSLLQDSASVDGMNELSGKFIDLSIKDSAEYYADSAYRHARSIHYIHGMAQALSRKASMQSYFSGNFVKGEELDRASIDLYGQTPNKRGLAATYNHLAFVCFSQAKYDEALHLINKEYSLHQVDRDTLDMMDNLDLVTQIHLKRGEFDKGFDAAQTRLQLSSKMGDSLEIKGTFLDLGSLCMGIEDYPLALTYYRAVFQHFTPRDSLALLQSEDLVWAKMEYAEIYSHLNQFDSAQYRYSLLDTTGLPEKDLRIFLVSKGEYYLLSRQFEKALPCLLKGLAIHVKLNDGNEIVRTVLDVAGAYNGLHQPGEALRYAREGLDLGLKTNARQRMRDAYKLLYSVYDQRGQTDSAYFYYRAYIRTKESLTDDQTKGRFAANQYLERIENLNNEKLIGQQQLKIRDQQLKRESLIRYTLIAFVVLVLLLGALQLRNIVLARRNEKLVNENMRKELQHKTSEMEMQALRAQMNPHFIFNCLNSINRFILKNEPQAAADYLTQFSRLIRLVLNNSKKAWIPLEDEIDMLRLYLEMEKLRFKDAFTFEFVTGNGIDAAALFIPPLLIQPFVENAIWHGLMHKKGPGLLTLSFLVENDMLRCAIIDNGVGRSISAQSENMPGRAHKSMGIRITKDRLALINGALDDERVIFSIEDLVDRSGSATGTRVNLSIKFRQSSVPDDEDQTS